ncbi:Exodeoxyribonuclease V alpha chain [hydrothermal vent metagenome]|uniref:Exodeoxyribonuclease V alpha chain n=1 Tax=hydrothermal vent metagenome TaxID=652676 RepID=A0A3B0ZC36_9ZZZZ
MTTTEFDAQIAVSPEQKESNGTANLAAQFSAFMLRLNSEKNYSNELELASWLVSQRLEQGHVCLDLRSFSGRQVYFPGREQAVILPNYEDWLQALQASSVVGKPGEFRPLILDQQGRLYLQRYWRYEQCLAQAIYNKAQPNSLDFNVDMGILKKGVKQLFSTALQTEPDWQRVAVINAVLRRFCIISGGPGTGKTTTVIKLLILLVQQASDPLRIILGAPTGKAAARLQESIRSAKANLKINQNTLDQIPEEAVTLHRLLGVAPGVVSQRKRKQLAADVVIIDEASMIDLSLMVKLVEMLPSRCRLILLGDKDQLSSVSAGSVLSDLCQQTGQYSAALVQHVEQLGGDVIPLCDGVNSAIQDSVVILQKSYRFKEDSGIGRLAKYTLLGNESAFIQELKNQSSTDIAWIESKDETQTCTAALTAGYKAFFQVVHEHVTPEKIFSIFDRFRILAAHRHGRTGVDGLNARVEQIFQKEYAAKIYDQWYAGRPVMVLENNNLLGVANGDIGLVLHSVEHNNELRVFFESSGGEAKLLHPERLPRHETAFAITVHKSQGSEFEQIMFVLPEDNMPILSRELLYTAITRAKEKIILSGSELLFKQALKRSVVRSSGLMDQINTL